MHKPFDWSETIEDLNKNQQISELYLSILMSSNRQLSSSSRRATADSLRRRGEEPTLFAASSRTGTAG
ncbi:hypothetical protein F2Q68_00031218 [Brassica cretica]|uniref:Uncharacterized protein n=1 Tax=Brassica cretica TaxID=69181 RepID=A0A8S9GDI7_BRACR|nr:hypothetical protein F2Q68_00031218 [Brassica cretica]